MAKLVPAYTSDKGDRMYSLRMDKLQVISGNADALRKLAESLNKQVQQYRYVRVNNPATHTITPGLEFSKDVYNNMIGSA